MNTEPICILVCALGGEGGGVLSEWLYDVSVRSGHAAQATSIPGVAQRTGATTYYVEVCPLPEAALGGRRPVFSLNPVPGRIDLLVSSEMLETVRQVGNAMSAPERTLVLSSSARALTVMEKMQQGDGRLDDAALLAMLQRASRASEVFDMGALARDAGTAISAVLFGAIAASGVLPFAREAFEATIRAGGKGVEASLRGFALGFERVARGRAAAEVLAMAAPPAFPATAASVVATEPPLPAAWSTRFPPALHRVLALAHARLVDYQDAGYAELFAQRMDRLVAAELSADPNARENHALSEEAARWLALWMAFDDIVRVAALKLRTSRLARVRREVAARDDEIVKVYDHFKPGVAEFAALLPESLARRLERWDAARRTKGAEPFALPLRLGAHTVLGTLALRIAASLKGQRRRGSRFRIEQALIERWLGAVEQGTRRNWTLGLELARCGRLIKGYGSTNERGKRNLLHIVDHLSADAAAVQAAREAALADEGGKALDAALIRHGAPARPVIAQPVRFYKRRPAPP